MEVYVECVVIFFYWGKVKWVWVIMSFGWGCFVIEGLFLNFVLKKIFEFWVSELLFDVVFCFCMSMYFYSEIKVFKDVLCFVDFVDVDSEKWVGYFECFLGIKWFFYGFEVNCNL